LSSLPSDAASEFLSRTKMGSGNRVEWLAVRGPKISVSPLALADEKADPVWHR
jgi:hypothetical protein